MKFELIDKTIEVISFLVANTSWGQRTNCKSMLKLLYAECRELEASLNNMDLRNVIEEVADVVMMTAYFCCKLSNGNIDYVKKFFYDAAASNELTSYTSSELYRKILINYNCLIASFTDDTESLNCFIYECVSSIVSCALTLASLVQQKTNQASNDIVFSAIIAKLKRRYPDYFQNATISTNILFEERNWIAGKKFEKDLPYSYCNNPKCSCFRKLCRKNIVLYNNQVHCKVCGQNVASDSVLFPDKSSEERRAILETLESHLMKFNKGDDLIANLYSYTYIDNCTAIFTYLLGDQLPFSEVIRFFSNKCLLKVEVVKNFLNTCFYSLFSFEMPSKKPRVCAKTIKVYIINFSAKLVDLLMYLDIPGDILLWSIAQLYEKPTINCWKQYREQTWIVDLKRKKSIFPILLILDRLIKTEYVTNIILKNVSPCVQIDKYTPIINYIFINQKFNIKRFLGE